MIPDGIVWIDGNSSYPVHNGYNGIAWGITSILFYLSIYHLIIYFKARDRYFLFYSMYALVNAVNVLKYIKNLFFEDSMNAIMHIFHHFHFPLQYASYILFSLFALEILQFRTRNPGFYKNVYKYIGVLTVLIILLIIGRYTLNDYFLLRGFYFYVFVPISLVISIYSVFLIIKIQDRVKMPILMGMILITNAAIAVAHLTMGNRIAAINQYFYILFFPVN